MKIYAGTLVKEKVREVQEQTREGRINRVSKYVVGCFQDVIVKKKFLVQFEYGQNIDMSSCSLQYICLKQWVFQKVDDPISGLPQKKQGELLTVYGDHVGEEGSMFERGIYYLYFIVCVFFHQSSVDMLEQQVLEESDPDLEEEDDI